MQVQNADFNLLKLYRQRVAELRKHPLIAKKLLKSNLSFEINQSSTKFEAYEIDSDRLRGYLTLLRPLCLQKEDVYIFKILKILDKYVEGDVYTQNTREIKKAFEQKGKHNTFRFNLMGRSLLNKDIWDVYMNGKYFHWDSEKTQIIEALKDIDGAAHSAFLSVVVDKTECVLLVDDMLQKYLGV